MKYTVKEKWNDRDYDKAACTYEYDDRKGTYDVKFTNGDRVYDFEVLAPTGKIIEYEWKVNGY